MSVATDEATDWVTELRGPAARREPAIAELHALLLRASRFELSRRRGQLAHLGRADVDDLATQAADDALVAVLAKLDDYAGRARFTTWAYKFALLEASVKARRRAWHGREVVVDHELWPEPQDGGRTAQERLEERELMDALRDAIATDLTTHQREVFTALAGEDADARVPGMLEHLHGCPACREEHDSLRDLLSKS